MSSFIARGLVRFSDVASSRPFSCDGGRGRDRCLSKRARRAWLRPTPWRAEELLPTDAPVKLLIRAHVELPL